MSLKSFVKDSERLTEEVCCTAQGDVNLSESLFPSPFLVEGFKTAMLFIHDRLLRIQHETIDGGHRCLPIVCSGLTVAGPASSQQLYERVDDVIL